MTAFDETITDPVGITDSVATAKSIPVTVTDALGLLDSVATAKSVPVVATDAVGVVDPIVRVHDAVRTPTDAVGILDSIVAAKSVPVTATDPLGIVDDVTYIDLTSILLPSIDGASAPPGIQLLNVDPNASTDIYLPSIDGAVAPPGIGLYTDNQLAVMAAGAEVYGVLHDPDGAWLADLEGTVTLDWQDVLNDTGIGTLTLNRHDTDAALVTIGCEVRCYLYGELVFTWIVEQPPTVELYDPGDESAETIVARGRGRVSRLEEAIVYPPKSTDDPLAAAHRLYSFASIGYATVHGVPFALGWPEAVQGVKASTVDAYRKSTVEYTTVLSGAPDVVETVEAAAPIGFPDPDAYWIWGQADTTVLGFNFFRRQLIVTQSTTIAFVVTADNYYTLYLDGNPILGENEDSWCWSGYKRVDLILPAGTYQLAAVVENIPLAVGVVAPPQANPGGFLFTAFTFDEQGDPTAFLARSDSSWTALAYPTVWPGWNPGRIIEDMILEAQARGALAGFTYSFSWYADSNGVPWSVMEGFSSQIGASVLDALNSLVEEGWVDYRLAPGGLRLDMFVQGSGLTASTTLQATGVDATTNIETYSIEPQASPKTRLFVKWTAGQFQLNDAAAQALYGVKEAFYAIDAATKTGAIRQGQVILDNINHPRDAIVVSLAPKTLADRPYTSYVLGDRVPCPDRTGSINPERLLGITVAHNENGIAQIGLELATRPLRREREQADLFKQLGRGFTGSTKVRQTLTTTGGVNR